MQEITKFAFYGSLRKGCYNHTRFFSHDRIMLLGTYKIPGYKLIDLGAFPAAVPYNTENTITIEVYDIPSPQIRSWIDGMELGAGYERTVIKVEEHECVLYTYNRHIIRSERVVESGDWVSHLKSTQNEMNDCTVRRTPTREHSREISSLR